MTEKNTNNDTKTASHKSSINPLGWVVAAILLLSLAVAIGIYRSSTMKMKEVHFSGNHFVPLEELQKVDIPMGISPDSIDFIKIMHRYEQIPYVRQADISVEPGGDLFVKITERQPVALLVDGENKIYVDRDGLRLPMNMGKTVDVPILYGFRASPKGDTLKSGSFKMMSDFLVTVRNNAVSDATISEVAWTKKNGVVALTNQNGVKLIFGKGDYETRLRNWEAFYGEIIKQKGIEKMRSVDLRFEGQIVTREK